MWRSFFLAIGIMVLLIGIQFLGVEKVILTLHDDPPPRTSPFDPEVKAGPPLQFSPPPWAAWSFMSTGLVICLYSFTIPRRINTK